MENKLKRGKKKEEKSEEEKEARKHKVDVKRNRISHI